MRPRLSVYAGEPTANPAFHLLAGPEVRLTLGLSPTLLHPMLRDSDKLYLSPKERDEFHRLTGLFVSPGTSIPVDGYNNVLEVAAREALATDVDGFGPIDAALIRGLMVVSESDALTDDQRLRQKFSEQKPPPDVDLL